MMPDSFKQVMEEGECCICGGPLKGSHVNFVNLEKIATWSFPVWGNILVDEPWQRAMAVLCDNCVDEEKGVIKGEVKRALEIRDGAPVYHDVDELEDAPPITKKMVDDGERKRAQEAADSQRETLHIMLDDVAPYATALRGIPSAEDINAKLLEQSKYYLMLVNEGYLHGLRDPNDPQHPDFLRQLEVVRRTKKRTLIVYVEKEVSIQDLEQLREEFMQGIDVYDCIPMGEDVPESEIKDALKRMLDG